MQTKTILVVAFAVLSVALVGVSVYQNRDIITGSQKIFSCQSDMDCVLAYTGNEACAPCDQAGESIKCVSSEEAERLQQERVKKHGQVLCDLCERPSVEFFCVCQNGSCTKIAKQKENLLIDETIEWNVYSNSNVNFTFKYPQDWEIREDNFYKESTVPTIVVCRKSEEKYVTANCVQINMPQAPQGKRETRIEGNYIVLYSEDPELLAVYDKLIATLKFIK